MPKRKRCLLSMDDRSTNILEDPKPVVWKRPEDVFEKSEIVWDYSKKRFIAVQTAVGTEEDITDINSQNSNDSDARKAQNDNESRSSVLDLTMTSFHTGQMKAVSIESVSTPDAYPMCSSFIEQQEDELQEKDERQVSTPPVHCYQKKYHTSPNISEMMSAYEDNYEVDSLSSISNSDLKVGSVVCEDSTENKCHSLDTASTSSCIRQDQEMALAKSSELYRTEQGGSSPNISEVMSSCDEHQTTESISSCNSGYAEAEVVGIRGSEWLQGMGKTVSVPKPSVRSLPVKHINNKNAVDLIKKMKKVKGGFLEQLEEVLIKDREASKTLRKETTAVKVRLRNLRTYSSKLVADCIVIATESLEFKDLPPSNKLGIVLSNSTVQKWCIHQDIVLHIIPPWETLYVSELDQWFLLCPTVIDVDS